ncbi:MAG: proton-conducting transporter membrane subunit [Thiobacillaceae bacterium]
MLVLTPLLVPLFTALLTALLAGHAAAHKGVSLLGGVTLLVCAASLLLDVMHNGRQSVALGDWPLPYAIEFAADSLSAALVLITAALGAAVLLYQWHWGEATAQRHGLQPLVHALLAATCAVFLAADLFNLYVWFELMLISMLGLLVLGGKRQHAEAAFKYFAVSMLGTLLMLVAVGMIYGATGQLNFSALRVAAAQPQLAGALLAYVGLLLLAFLLKAGAFPLFAWLPASYPTLPAPSLALAGGLLTKVAAYALLRLLGDIFIAPRVMIDALGWLAVITMLSGVLGAAYHWDLRRILAFHIISQIGYLLLGIALATSAGEAATAYFLFHNILVKANLFLIAGLMWASSGHYDLRRIGGLYPARPLLALLFLLSAFSLVGVPPSTGFWGKFMLINEAFAQRQYVWGGVALAVGLLTLYSMSKIWLEGFMKPQPPTASNPDRINAAAVAPLPMTACAAVMLLSLLILIMGIFPEPFIRYVEVATAGFWQVNMR